MERQFTTIVKEHLAVRRNTQTAAASRRAMAGPPGAAGSRGWLSPGHALTSRQWIETQENN
jgi:hypothetical protein